MIIHSLTINYKQMKDLFKSLFIILLVSVFFVSCEKEEDDDDNEPDVVEFVHPTSMTPLWETTNLGGPESAIYDKERDQIFVSVQNPGNTEVGGYISKINVETGAVVDTFWVQGLSNAITGMGIYENTLYIAEDTVLTEINITSGDIITKHDVETAVFLNDVFVTSTNVVYVSDTFGNAIYKLENGTVELVVQATGLESPNGLWIEDNNLLVASFGVITDMQTFTADPTYVYSIDLDTKAITKFGDLTTPIGNMDGISEYGEGNYFISDWTLGKIIYLKSTGEMNTLLTLNQGTADIHYIDSKKVLLIPMAFDGKLAAYTVE